MSVLSWGSAWPRRVRWGEGAGPGGAGPGDPRGKARGRRGLATPATRAGAGAGGGAGAQLEQRGALHHDGCLGRGHLRHVPDLFEERGQFPIL